MGKSTETKYYCDKCHKKLGTFMNDVAIITRPGDDNKDPFWQRFNVGINFSCGIHNDQSENRAAELCQACTAELLEDATKRVRAGERKTKGYGDSEQQGWEK